MPVARADWFWPWRGVSYRGNNGIGQNGTEGTPDETHVPEEELFRIENEVEERFSPTNLVINSVIEEIEPLWQVFK